MFRLVYDVIESEVKEPNEVYILYYENKIYYSMWILNPVKVEICRKDKYIFINNLNVWNDNDKKFARNFFDFLSQMKDMLEIEGYTMREETSSSKYYVELYGEYII